MNHPILNVLLVEDSPGMALMVDAILKQPKFSPCNFKVKILTNLKEAIEDLQVFHPDVILLDLTLPDSDGYNTFRAIKDLSQCPIVVLSGRLETDLAIRLVLEGAADVVEKGLTPVQRIGWTVWLAWLREENKRASNP